MSELLSIQGVPLVGLYIRASEDYAVVGVRDEKVIQIVEEELEVKAIRTTIAGSELVGAMVAMNSTGAVVCRHVRQKEIEKISRYIDVRVVDTNMTCLGNNILINDYGAIVHPELDRALIEEISDFFGIKILVGTIGGIKTVGMSACVTNKGALVNPNSTEWEMKRLSDILKVPVEKGTINFGSDMVGTGVVANTKGYIAGRDTTGFELGVVEEALGFI
ncbi:translation initiation factor 6 (aeIF-6) [Archaeoglobus sulfaticallidus PM70-1]|uniref:Translation initiation factor 6 n=1 Tax=Archaeoglobus sulfaticallidus PM70-1 TaxID=387631 RepID=N0BI37_9EURY|nr:translation initiation factor IF-6 [Archaeoglobus sulfaticallidus]AGK60106.1 translation initiation factor 6 (aeIF-6) [Archaeoglobus sulfaticallidus PM70-1]